MASSVVLDGGGDFLGTDSLFQYSPQMFESYSSQSISVPFHTKSLTFGDLVFGRIPKKDDVVKSIYLKTVLGPLLQTPSTGYVYPLYATDVDTDIYIKPDLTNPVIAGIGTIGYLNTQLFSIWIYESGASVIYNSETNRFEFTSSHPLTFKSEQAASFWGFDVTVADSISGGTYTFNNPVPTLNLVQSGWIPGFQPPSANFKYNDSVGDLMVQTATMYIGAQAIQSISSNVLMIEDDLQVPLENQAGLTITVGRNDTSSSSIPRTYWTRLDFDKVPMSSLYDQTVEIGIQFEQFQNLTSRSLLGGLLNGSAYTEATRYQHVIYQGSIAYKNLFIQISSNLITVYNETINSITDIAANNQGTGICIHNGVLFLVTPDAHLLTYDITSTGLTFREQSTYSLLEIADGLISISKFIYIFSRNGSIIVYDATKDINLASSYFYQTNPDHTPYTTVQYIGKLLNGTTASYVAGFIYAQTDDVSHLLKIDPVKLRSNADLSGTYQNIVLTEPLNNVQSTFVPDSRFMYFTYGITDVNNGVFARLDTELPFLFSSIEFSHVLPNIDFEFNVNSPIPSHFDGEYMYYVASSGGGNILSILFFFNTTMSFTDPNAWTWIAFNRDGSTLSSNGAVGKGFSYGFYNQEIHMVQCTSYIYLTSFGTPEYSANYMIRIDPYQVIPSIQSQLVVEYSKLENPHTQSVSLVNQNKKNIFTIRAGETSDIFSLTFSGPIREFWIQSTAAVQRMVIELNGEVLVDEDGTSLSVLRPFATHIRTPDHTLYTYSIAVDPNTIQPTGTLNISRIRLTTLNVFLKEPQATDQTITVYSRSVNVLDCEGGIGGLMFN